MFRRRKPKSVFNKRGKTPSHLSNELMCRVVENVSGKLEFISPKLESTNINDIIKEDKKYGVFKPANGKYFTYKVLNEDEEISKREAKRIIKYSFLRATRRISLKFKPAKNGEIVDFRIEFRTVESDPDKQLKPNTLMYHYYPISSLTHPLRGLCVVNKKYYWTSHGKSLPLSVIDEINYPKPTTTRGKTYDFDQVYTHEALGHGLGLPHANEAGHIMSFNYGIMAEFLSDQDVLRLQAKYPKREMSEHLLNRWLDWLKSASDR